MCDHLTLPLDLQHIMAQSVKDMHGISGAAQTGVLPLH